MIRNSGFSGKGFKFDDTERELANEKKKLQKAALGLQDSDDEDAGMDVSMMSPLSSDIKALRTLFTCNCTGLF